MEPSDKSCFVTLPFGKLLPSINKISGSLSMQRHNWTANWVHACDTADYKSIKALAKLLNEWRETEIYYRVPQSELKYHTKHHYANQICQVLCLLAKNENSVNHHVELILTEILSFYYRRFDAVEVFVTFAEFIDEMVAAAQKFILSYSTIKNKENIKELLNQPEIHLIAVNLGHLIDLLRDYDEKGPKIQKSHNPTPQSLEQATKVVCHIMELKCMAHLLSTLIFIKIDLLTFFQLHYESQWHQYQQQNQPMRRKEIAENIRQGEESQEKSPIIAQDKVLKNLKTVSFQGTLTSPLFSIRKIILALTKRGTNSKIFFAYITPLLRYLPSLVINCTSQQSQILVVPIIEELSNVFEDKMENGFSNDQKMPKLRQIDIALAFSQTAFLNDLEMVLIAHKIRQQKEFKQFENQQKDMNKYFLAVWTLKQKLVKVFQKTQQIFHQQRKINAKELIMTQNDDKNVVTIIRAQQFVAYYKNHSNTFNARLIFREKRKAPEVKIPDQFYEQQVSRYPQFINTEYFQNPIVQKFQTNYNELKYVKSILYPQAQNHKQAMKETFYSNQKIMKEREQNKNKNIKWQDNQRLNKQTKKLNQDKRQNLQFYLNQSQKYERITQFSIRLYPLVKKVYGQFTLKELTKMTQRFVYYLAKNQSHVQQIQTNVYNKKLRNIHEMISLRIDSFTSDKLHELLMSMLFEIMHAINTSERSLDSFYHLYYKNIPVHMQSMVLFYMVEIERSRPTKYKILFRNLFLNRMQAKDIYNLLKFMIKDARLNSMELKDMYQKIYDLLSERCAMMIQTVQQLLCRKIIPMVKQGSDKKERQSFQEIDSSTAGKSEEQILRPFFHHDRLDQCVVVLELFVNELREQGSTVAVLLQRMRKQPDCGSQSQKISKSPFNHLPILLNQFNGPFRARFQQFLPEPFQSEK